MSKPQSIRLSGLAFIAGAFAFITILSNSDPIAIPGSLISALLLAAGLWGLRAGYGEDLSRSGRSFLLVGAVGAILWDVLLVSLMVLATSGRLHGSDAQGQRFWIVILGAPAIALLGLTLYGFTALRSRPMPRMNWLPILAGIWYPAVYTFLFVYLVSHNGVLPGNSWSAFQPTFVIQFLVLCLFGSILVIDAQKELAMA